MPRLGTNRYGKAEVRVVRVTRGSGPEGGDLVRDWNVSTSLSGDLDASHLVGDNAKVLATDTQKNTVNAFTQRLGDVEPETLALRLAEHFVATQEPITRARVAVEQYPWERLAGHSFARSGQYVRTVVVVHDEAAGTSVVGGLGELTLLNSSGSEFWGFPRDAYTTLPETKDRMLATKVSAAWRFRPLSGGDEPDWGTAFRRAKDALLAAFADTYSYSLQQTLYAIGERVLGAVPALCEVRLALPNRHHFLVDLQPFGQDNANEVYYAADRPYGLIEGTVLADDAPDDCLAWT